MANGFIGGIISISIGIIMLANVFMTTVVSTNTDTWSASSVANLSKSKILLKSTDLGSSWFSRSSRYLVRNFKCFRSNVKMYSKNIKDVVTRQRINGVFLRTLF